MKILCLPSHWRVVDLLLQLHQLICRRHQRVFCQTGKNNQWALCAFEDCMDTGKKCFFFSGSLSSGHSQDRQCSTISQMAVAVCHQSVQKKTVPSIRPLLFIFFSVAYSASCAITTTTRSTYLTRKMFDFADFKLSHTCYIYLVMC